jgi:hypothetical protein
MCMFNTETNKKGWNEIEEVLQFVFCVEDYVIACVIPGIISFIVRLADADICNPERYLKVYAIVVNTCCGNNAVTRRAPPHDKIQTL